MRKLPAEIKLTLHAKQRLEERKDPEDYYNTKNLMKSSCKWYTKDDLIPKSNLYLHCLYVCRKSNQIGYLTNGKLEVLYNKGTGVAITIMEVKEKFLPITRYIKPEILEQIKRKKNKQKLNDTLNLEYCPTVNNETIIDHQNKSEDCIEEENITFPELYASLVAEILNYTSNSEYKSIETTKRNEQPYNIVHRKKTVNTRTISELFGVDKKVYEEALSVVKK